MKDHVFIMPGFEVQRNYEHGPWADALVTGGKVCVLLSVPGKGTIFVLCMSGLLNFFTLPGQTYLELCHESTLQPILAQASFLDVHGIIQRVSQVVHARQS